MPGSVKTTSLPVLSLLFFNDLILVCTHPFSIQKKEMLIPYVYGWALCGAEISYRWA